ncbi:MAG: putative CAMK family protein kinase, partial [Streblomastix strix]
MITEYCEGGDLRKNISELQKLPVKERLMRVWELFAQIALSLNHLHSHNVLHRDIKPENIFLMQDGSIRLGDFGLAKILTENDYATYAGTKTTEQSDIFAFGCVIFELLTGQHPFQGKSKQEHEMIENIKNGKVAQLPDWVSQGMKEIVMAMLSKKSEDRPKASVILEQDTIKMYLRSRNMNTRSNIPNNQTN